MCVRNPASGLFQIGNKLENDNDVTICQYDVIVKFFCRCFVSLVKFSYSSKLYVNISKGPKVMTIYFYKGLTRNWKIRNTLIWILLNIWRLGRVRDTKFRTDFSNEMLLNAAKCQGYSLYCFWVIKGKQTAGKKPPYLD